MTSDMVPIERSFPGREDIEIYPVFDLHLGAAECMEGAWAMFKKRVLDKPNAYIVIGGDMMNNGIKSSVTNVYEETMRPREQKKRLVEELAPLRDRIICMTGGNHERRTARESDQNPMYDVACKLVFDAQNRRVTQKQFRVLVATSWLGYGGYAMQGMMTPTAHCISALHLKGDRKEMRVEM